MGYLIAIGLIVFYCGFYVFNGDLTKNEIDKYLIDNVLSYKKHQRIFGDKELRNIFKEDVNPFLFLLYKIQFYEISSQDGNGNEVRVYVKWYRRNMFFFKSKGIFISDVTHRSSLTNCEDESLI